MGPRKKGCRGWEKQGRSNLSKSGEMELERLNLVNVIVMIKIEKCYKLFLACSAKAFVKV
jgi:hypothetical protein